MDRMTSRLDQQTVGMLTNTHGVVGGGWGASPQQQQQQQWDAGQIAREQAQRLYNQQMQQAQRYPQQQSHARSAVPQDLNNMTGYDDDFNAFNWDAPHASHAMQHQYPAAQFGHRSSASMHQDRQLHPSMQPCQAFNLEPQHRDLGSGDLASTMSLANSSGTEGRAGGLARGPNKRKGGRSRKAPPNDSNTMQRCLEVVEQLLDEEDAEPFAEPVDTDALGLHDYHQVIRHPMDLGTVKRRLMAEPLAYSSSADALRDVQQVWANCRSYNDEDDPIIDMCDNMERFFYQAWKEASLPLPPGAGPTLSRTRPKDPSKGQPLAWAEEQQGSKGNKRKHTSAHYEEPAADEFDDSLQGPHSIFGLPETGSVPHHKRRKATNPTSTGTASSHQGAPGHKKKTAGAAESPVLQAPPPLQLSAQEQEAEKSDKEAVAAWDILQRQRTKAQLIIQTAQEAVRNLNEAQATLDDIHKAVAAQEAAQAAAEALHSWPADARLVPSTHPKHPVAQPQLLHADIATLGSYLSSLPGGISAQTDNATATDADLAADGYGASTSAHHAVEAEGGRKGSSSQGDDADVDGIDARQQRTDKTKPNGDGSGAGPNADLMASGWQRRLQTVLPKQQIHQIIAEPWNTAWHTAGRSHVA